MKKHGLSIVITNIRISICFVLISIPVVLGCGTSPPKNEIRDQIIKYFEMRNYRVVDIDISAIESIPQGEKIYMGTEGYVVRMKSITLEATKQNTQFKLAKGQRFIFKNGSIRIKKGTGELQRWIITDMNNIHVL
jgi:DNA modification methylase